MFFEKNIETILLCPSHYSINILSNKSGVLMFLGITKYKIGEIGYNRKNVGNIRENIFPRGKNDF